MWKNTTSCAKLCNFRSELCFLRYLCCNRNCVIQKNKTSYIFQEIMNLVKKKHNCSRLSNLGRWRKEKAPLLSEHTAVLLLYEPNYSCLRCKPTSMSTVAWRLLASASTTSLKDAPLAGVCGGIVGGSCAGGCGALLLGEGARHL